MRKAPDKSQMNAGGYSTTNEQHIISTLSTSRTLCQIAHRRSKPSFQCIFLLLLDGIQVGKAEPVDRIGIITSDRLQVENTRL